MTFLSAAVPGYRPWPAPRTPWLMAQTWSDLLFAHWPLAPADVQPLLPAGLRLDTFDASAWIGVVPFRMSGVRPRQLPAAPWLSAFPELNVRTYVTQGGIPGVLFFSLDAGNPLAVAIARRSFHLPYFRARMTAARPDGVTLYSSDRTHTGAPAAAFRARYRPVARGAVPQPGTLAYFLTARYCLYTTDGRGRLLRAEIDHAPWLLQPAEATISVNTMAAAAGLTLPNSPPLLHFARRLSVVVWPLRRVAS